MVNPGISYHFYWNPKNERDCYNWPCKSAWEPCKNRLRVWIMFPVHTVGFRYATATCLDGKIPPIWFDGVRLFFLFFVCWRYCELKSMRLPLVYSVFGVREARLCDVRSNMLFAPYGHHVPSWEWIQGYFSPTHWGVLLLKTCIFNPLDRRGETVFLVLVKADIVTSTPVCGLPMEHHGCLWATIRVYSVSQ
jgi:hypothetical protein